MGDLTGRGGKMGRGRSPGKAPKVRPVAAPPPGAIQDLFAAYAARRWGEVVEKAGALTRQWPGHAVAWKVLGTTLCMTGSLEPGLAALSQAASLAPNDHEIHNGLGNALAAVGRLVEAEASYRRALTVTPDFAAAASNLANVLRTLGRLEEAESCSRRALALHPRSAEICNNLGNIEKDLGRLAEARVSFERAIALQPDYAEAYSNLGNTLLALGQVTEAEASLRQALTLKPNFHEAHLNLGNILSLCGNLVEAEASYRRALAINPADSRIYNNLGQVLTQLGRTAEALACYRRTLEICPENIEAHSNLLYCLAFTPDLTPQQGRQAAETYGRKLEKLVTRRFAPAPRDIPPQRLRVGMVSGDLRSHPVGYFIENVLAHIDPARIELTAYSASVASDDTTRRLQRYFPHWVSLIGLNDDDAAALIHSHDLDVLIDLSGHTSQNRLPVFARKPAPVQVSWLGYFATTGLPQMDYVLGDPVVTPAGEESHFCEKVWRMPETYLCFTAPAEASEVGPLPAQAPGRVTFGCFNNLSKMNDAVVASWARILRALPEARLFLKTRQLDDASARAATQARFSACGITADRLILEGHSPRAEHIRAYDRVDIGLDPFPYPGGTTSVEAMWMGVPVLTRRGDRFLAHVGETVAVNAGMEDWIAGDDEDYLAKAVAIANDPTRLADLRANLRRRLLETPLFDAPRFARHLEAALWGMIRQARER